MSAFRGVSWGVVFLLGGGFALSLGIEKSGLMIFISTEVEWMKNHVGRFVFPLLITLTVTFATELVSNVATASIILPILANIGAASANLGLIPGESLPSVCVSLSVHLLLSPPPPPPSPFLPSSLPLPLSLFSLSLPLFCSWYD